MSPPIHPLTSSQGAVFLVNSCQRYFRCGPHHFRYFARRSIPVMKSIFCKSLTCFPACNSYALALRAGVSIKFLLIHSLWKYPKWWGQALSRSYGCFFAEFLGDHSLVRLGLLDLITCVGLRYGFYIYKFREFSWKRALYYHPVPKN